MLKKSAINLFVCCFLLFICIGCTKAAVTESVPFTDTTSEITSPSTSTPLPTPTFTPTPVPIQCDITFDSDRDENLEVYSMEPDGNNQVNLTNNPADDYDPVWSPDGSQIAFISNRDNGEGGGQFVYVMDADGSNVRQLTFEENCRMPDWSHDGTHITYNSNDDIYVIPLEGKNPGVNLTSSPETDVNPEWSPDGTKILWSSSTDNQSWHVFVMNADGSGKQQLTFDGALYDAAWSIDNRILVSAWDSPEHGCCNFVMNADGSNVTNAGGKGEFEKLSPFFTKNGDMVGCMSGQVNGDDEEIALVGEIFQDWFLNLTNNEANDRNPDWPANCTIGRALQADLADATEQTTTEPAQANEPFVFGYTGGRDSIDEGYENDLLTACEELEIECIEGESIKDLSGQQVDAILAFYDLWKVDQDYDMINEAVSNGILTIVLNAETSVTGAYNLSIDTDATKRTIELMIKEMEGNGKIILFNFGDNETQLDIINDILQQNPEIKSQIISGDFEGSTTTEDKITELVNANPDVKAIWTNNRVPDFFWPVKNSTKNPLPMVLIEPKLEMLEHWQFLADEDRGFKGVTTIKPGGTGYEGVYTAYYILNGETINPDALGGLYGNTFIYDYPFITNEDLNDWIDQSVNLRENSSGELEIPPMLPEEIWQRWFE